ncbi:MAG: hypothetical protein ABSC06_20115 [Rhodopila sp.]
MSGIAAFAGTVIYDQLHDHPNKRLAAFTTCLRMITWIAFWSAIGIPAAAITLLICIVWPPMLIVIVVGVFLTIGWKVRNVPMPAGTANSDFVTPLLIGVLIGSSIHHDR